MGEREKRKKTQRQEVMLRECGQTARNREEPVRSQRVEGRGREAE